MRWRSLPKFARTTLAALLLAAVVLQDHVEPPIDLAIQTCTRAAGAGGRPLAAGPHIVCTRGSAFPPSPHAP